MSFEPNPSYRCQMHSVLTNLSVLKSSLVSLFQLQIYPDREEYEAQQVYFSSSKQSYVTQHCKKYSKSFLLSCHCRFLYFSKRKKFFKRLASTTINKHWRVVLRKDWNYKHWTGHNVLWVLSSAFDRLLSMFPSQGYSKMPSYWCTLSCINPLSGNLMKPFFIILLCLMPDFFCLSKGRVLPLNGLTKQSANASSNPSSDNAPWCTLLYHFTLSNTRWFFSSREECCHAMG